ncbi:VPS10 domain-containing protein [Flocculibacter collagenilyticus]|uniref:VPS10 domain-containing protein n=1 Tax=Flocculibacter collagenilyticus TaxID=2744479 RepID=UPI0018F50A2A|nr:glycosyl hydrolase [Flocculibacter collagenilyticus]
MVDTAYVKYGLVFLCLCLLVPLAPYSHSNTVDASVYTSLPLRNIGPAITGGRISDFAVNPNNPAHYYVAAASGGVWKTTNAGTTWETVFDRKGSYSIGALAMDPSNPNIIWVGTGENNAQRSVSYGDGVYKSLDGGKTWYHKGLHNSEHIGKIIIDPRNPNTVYVAAQGPLWNKGGERGLYKTTNGGETWEIVLGISPHTGVNEVIFEPGNPDVLYASTYQRRRHVWTLINGGPESAIYKSENAGRSWRAIMKGLPNVDLGRIGLTISPVKPYTLYAIVEAAEGQSGFFRSTDAGGSWQRQSNYNSNSPQYYQEIVADPHNPDRVYSLDTYLMVTEDGGKTFQKAGEAHKHVDNHALWINPNNTDHLLIGTDGGVYESWDRAANWSFKSNMPLTQFYGVTVDNDLPFYNIFGGSQDNASLGAPHRTTNSHGIRNSDWRYTQFGDGFKTVIDPTDPNIIYSQYQYGGLARYDKRSGERVQIKPVSPNPNIAQRFNWSSPLLISPHNPSRLYYASQQVFKSDDKGNSWQAISNDLSRNLDRNKMKVMDKVWSIDAVAKNKSTSFYGAVIALAESPIKEGLLYAGTDDGLIQYTEDGGKQWQKTKWPLKVPRYSYVSDIDPSLFEEGTVFASFDNHKRGDFKPYLFRSDNKGKKWVDISGNLPSRGTVHAIAQDHKNKDLLFAGTEFGIFFSQNGGMKWHQLRDGIPTIAIRDIDIQQRESDLALASFGRGFFILDDYSPLRVNADELTKQPITLFPVRRVLQYVEHDPLGLPDKAMQGANFYTAPNPPYGALINYYVNESFKSLKQQRKLKERQLLNQRKDVQYPSWETLKAEELEQPASLIFSISDKDGNLVRRLTTQAKQGFHRINWDLRYPSFDPVVKEGQRTLGTLVAPGTYTVTVAKYEQGKLTEYEQQQTFEVANIDSRTFSSNNRQQDVAFDLKVGQLNKAIVGMQRYLETLNTRVKEMRKAITETLQVTPELLTKIDKIEKALSEVDILVSGNFVIAKYAEPTATPVADYIGYLIWSRSESLSPVSPLQELRYQRASDGYHQAQQKLTKIVSDINELRTRLKQGQVGWIPGMMPPKLVEEPEQ